MENIVFKLRCKSKRIHSTKDYFIDLNQYCTSYHIQYNVIPTQKAIPHSWIAMISYNDNWIQNIIPQLYMVRNLPSPPLPSIIVERYMPLLLIHHSYILTSHSSWYIYAHQNWYMNGSKFIGDLDKSLWMG